MILPELSVGLAVYVPLYRFTEDRIPLLIEQTLQATKEISRLLGYNYSEYGK